jgi:FkbM family methyltransferase
VENFSNNYSSQRAFIRESSNEEVDYSAHQSLVMSLLNNKLISFCIILSLIVFFGVVVGEKSKIFSRFIPTLRGEIVLSDGYVITSIDHKYPILIKKSDPRIGYQLRYKGTVDSRFDEAALNLYMKGDTVVEVGAHYGYNSIMIGQALRMNGKYIAIEGNPGVSRCLYKNIVLNDLSDTVEIVRKAVSDHQGTCAIDDLISAVPDEEGKHSIVTRTVTVECDSLDEILKDKKVSLILINLPSSLFTILKGAQRILNESRNLQILARLNIDKIAKTIDVRKELNLLRQRGLRFYEVTSPTEIKEVFVDEIISKKKLVILIKKDR